MTDAIAPQPGPAALERAARRRDPSVLALVVLGVALLVMACVPRFSRWVEEHLRTTRVLAVLLGFALLYQALLIHELNRVRERMLIVMQTLLAAFQVPGKGRPVQGATPDDSAFPILVAALRSPSREAREAAHRQLQRLTGQDLGTDPADWESWESRKAWGSRPPNEKHRPGS